MNALDFDVADCVARVRLRNQDAAWSLVEYLSPLVRSIVRRRLPCGAAEEDLVQEIFSKMFQKLDQYKGEVPFAHWLSRIAVNHSLNAIRSHRARPELRMADLPREQEAALEQAWIAGNQSGPGHAMASRELVEKLLGTLRPQDCRLIRMLDIEGFSIAEVRDATGWSAACVRLRAFRARQRLYKRFAQLNQEGPVFSADENESKSSK